MIPSLDEEFIKQVYKEPVSSNTMLSLERATNTSNQPKTKGLPRPDLSVARNAWLFVSLKEGTQLQAIVQDGDYKRIDTGQLLLGQVPAYVLYPRRCRWHGHP